MVTAHGCLPAPITSAACPQDGLLPAPGHPEPSGHKLRLQGHLIGRNDSDTSTSQFYLLSRSTLFSPHSLQAIWPAVSWKWVQGGLSGHSDQAEERRWTEKSTDEDLTGWRRKSTQDQEQSTRTDRTEVHWATLQAAERFLFRAQVSWKSLLESLPSYLTQYSASFYFFSFALANLREFWRFKLNSTYLRNLSS